MTHPRRKVGTRLAVQVEVAARGGERGASTSADGLAARVAWSRPADQPGSLVLDPAVPLVSVNPAGPSDHPARDPRSLAPGRLSLLLALEVAPTGRAAADRNGAACANPADEHRESALGSTAYSWRTAQTWV